MATGAKRRGRPPNLAQVERILDTAERLFAERGYDATSMQALADDLEVNKALLFHYFASKDGLYAAVIKRFDEPLNAALGAEMDKATGPNDAIHRMVDAYWTFLVSRPTYARLLQWAYLSGGKRAEVLHAGNQERFEAMEGILEKAMGGDTERARQGYISFLGAALFYWINPKSVHDILREPHSSESALARRSTHLHDLVDRLLLPPSS